MHLKPADGGDGKTHRPRAGKTTTTFRSLEPGAAYRVWVRAQNEAGKGARVHARVTLPDGVVRGGEGDPPPERQQAAGTFSVSAAASAAEGGNATLTGSEIRLLADQRHAATKSSMVEVTLPAGQVSRPVYHRTVEEIWYILEGEGHVWRCPPIDMPPLSLSSHVARATTAGLSSPGDTLVIPTGWRFQFAAVSKRLRCGFCATRRRRGPARTRPCPRSAAVWGRRRCSIMET